MPDQTPHPTCWLPECLNAATGRGDEPRPCWAHTPDEGKQYPVIVTYTQTHVVWVNGDDPADAARRAQHDPWEMTHDASTLSSLDTAVCTPTPWEYESTVYEDGETYDGLPCDAHLKVWKDRERKAAQAVCQAANHPDRQPSRLRSLTPYCPTCCVLLDPEPVVEAVADVL